MKNEITILLAINKDMQNEDAAKRFLSEQADALDFLHPKTVLVDTITSYEQYMDFCIFGADEHFDTDFALVVQMDSFVANPNAWSDEFFEYDYIGAPWQEPLHPGLPDSYKTPYTKDLLVGNGGFSLRSKNLYSALKKVEKQRPYNEGEDVFICLNARKELQSLGVKFAPYEIAKKFSVERDNYVGQLGVHDWVSYKNNVFRFKESGDFNRICFLENVRREYPIAKSVDNSAEK